jgi:hemoglobin
MADKSLYDRLGGVFAIAAVVDHFSDAIVSNPKVGAPDRDIRRRKGPRARRSQRSWRSIE